MSVSEYADGPWDGGILGFPVGLFARFLAHPTQALTNWKVPGMDRVYAFEWSFERSVWDWVPGLHFARSPTGFPYGYAVVPIELV